MTIQDLSNILVVMDEQSINKASAKLYISQPSLSKCIKRIEQEYDILLFDRSKGSKLTLTEAGIRFQTMARAVMQSHQVFEQQIQWLRSYNENSILFGITRQRAYDFSGRIMKSLYEKYPGYFMDLKTISSHNMKTMLISRAIDIALLSNIGNEEELYYTKIKEADDLIYLRSGSPAAKLARPNPGGKYPVLSLQDVKDEVFTLSSPETQSRKHIDRLLARNHMELRLMEQSVYSLKISMANVGYASTIISDSVFFGNSEIDETRLYILPEEERMKNALYLACRQGFQKDKRYEIMQEVFRCLFEEG